MTTERLSIDNWKTDEIRAAERAFADAVSAAEKDLAEAELRMSESASRPATPEEIEELERFATSAEAPKEWRALAAKVASGELTWAAVTNGDAVSDPVFMAAVNATAVAFEAIQKAAEEADEAAAEEKAEPTIFRKAW